VEKGFLVVGIVHQAEDQAQAVVPRVGGRRKGGRERGREGRFLRRWSGGGTAARSANAKPFVSLPPSFPPFLPPSFLSHRRNSLTR